MPSASTSMQRSVSDVSPKKSSYRSKDHTTERKPIAQGKVMDIIFAEDKKDNSAMLSSFGNYQIGGYIGEGSFGKVFKGLNIRTGSFFAIKEIPLTAESTETSLPSILKE